MNDTEYTKDLKDYLDAFKRRRFVIAAIFGVIFLVGAAASLLWPATYQSSATILIEEQEIPSDLVRSTVTSYASQRIEVISQRVMTRTNLIEIIGKYNLYEEDLARKTTDEVVNAMREDINIEMISADVIDPMTGRPTVATIAFQLSFKGTEPEKVQRVANELTSLYLSENLKNREAKATETFDFLSDEAERIRDEISELESKLADFKEQNVHSLPELQNLNNQLLERAERDLTNIETQISAQEERRFYLEGQLAQLEPHGVDINMNPSARLQALRTEYLSQLSRYSSDHPDVSRLRREMEGLEQETGYTGGQEATLHQLATLRAELSAAKQVYSDEHPDVVQLTKAIAKMEEEVAKPQATAQPSSSPAASNPAFITLQSQLDAVANQIRNLHANAESVRAKMNEYTQRLTTAPQVERQYTFLTRELENSLNKYREIRAKQMEAQVSRQLEQERKGERFSLIDPAIVPEQPISPNRPAILFLSLVLATGAGFGWAGMREALDTSVRGTRGVAAALSIIPLAVIPYVPDRRERQTKRRRRFAAVAAVGVALVAGVLLAHFLWTPMDVLWFKALRKFSVLTGMG